MTADRALMRRLIGSMRKRFELVIEQEGIGYGYHLDMCQADISPPYLSMEFPI